MKAVEDEIATEKYGFKRLPNGTKTPLTGDYRPEIDSSQELDAKQQNYYQGLIGVLRWICELGRLDIVMPVSLMSRYLAQARNRPFESGLPHVLILETLWEIKVGL